VSSALEVYTIMRYINPHFTYLLIYYLLLNPALVPVPASRD